MLFLGTYEYAMDERGRLPLPIRFREALSGGIILTQGAPDPCVRAFPAASLEAQAELYMSEPGTRRKGRLLRRAFFGRSYPAELDRQGRVLIPTPMRRWGNLESQVVVVGVGEGFEIWDARTFEEVMAAEAEAYEQTLESVERR